MKLACKFVFIIIFFINFISCIKDYEIGRIEETETLNLSFNFAILKVNIISNNSWGADDKLDQYGVCYSESDLSPTINNCINTELKWSPEYDCYTVRLKSLLESTTYYWRAFIQKDDLIVYGEVQNFTTETRNDGVDINGIIWATHNVDMPGTFTAKPEDAGMFYQWNSKIGWSSTDPLINSNGGKTWNNSEITGNTWSEANEPCPLGWRVPTIEELKSLANAGSEWITLNSVAGRIFGNGDNTVFLPAAGYRSSNAGSLNSSYSAMYWSSTTNSSSYGTQINFHSSDVSFYQYYRRTGCSVRCVAE